MFFLLKNVKVHICVCNIPQSPHQKLTQVINAN